MKKIEMIQILRETLESLEALSKNLKDKNKVEEFLNRKDVVHIDNDIMQESYKISLREEYALDIYFGIFQNKSSLKIGVVDIFDESYEKIAIDCKVDNVIKTMEFLNCFEECDIEKITIAEDKGIVNSIAEENDYLKVSDIMCLLEQENIIGIKKEEVEIYLNDWDNEASNSLYLINNKIYLYENYEETMRVVSLKDCLIEIIDGVFNFALDLRYENPKEYDFNYGRTLKEIWTKWHTILDKELDKEVEEDWIKYVKEQGENIDLESLKDYLERVGYTDYAKSERVVKSLMETLGKSELQISEIDLETNKIIFVNNDREILEKLDMQELMYALFENYFGGVQRATTKELKKHFDNNNICVSEESIECLVNEWWHDCYEYNIYLHDNLILQEDLQQEEGHLKDNKDFMKYVATEILETALKNYEVTKDTDIEELERNVNYCYEWLKAISEEVPLDSQKVWDKIRDANKPKEQNNFVKVESEFCELKGSGKGYKIHPHDKTELIYAKELNILGHLKEKECDKQYKTIATKLNNDLLEDLFKTKLETLMPNIKIEKFEIKEDGYYLKHTSTNGEYRTTEIFTEGKDLKVKIIYSHYDCYPMEFIMKKGSLIIAQEQILEQNNVLTTEAFLLLRKLYQ